MAATNANSSSPPPRTMFPTLQSALHGLSIRLNAVLDKAIPPPHRKAIADRAYSFAERRPILASFLFAQLIFSGVPLSLLVLQVSSVILFALATAILVGSLCALALTVLCVGLILLVLVPVLMLTSFLGLTVWFWAFVGWYILSWTGMIERRAPKGEGKSQNASYSDVVKADDESNKVR